MSTLKSFFKNTIIYGIAAVLPRVINFLLVKVHTDALTNRSDYAANTDFYIWAGLFAVLLTFGMETTFFRFFKDTKKKDKLVSTAFIAMLISASLFATVLILFQDTFISLFGFENNPIRLKIFSGILIIDTLAMVPFAYLRASNRPIKYAVIKLLNVAVIVSVNLLFLKYIPSLEKSDIPSFISGFYKNTQLVNFIFIANLLGSLLSFLLLVPYLLQFKWSFDKVLFKKMLSYSWPIVIAGIAYLINENLDKILIGEFISKDAEGMYAAMYKIAIFMNLYIMAFRLGAEPFFFNHADKENAKETYAFILKYFVIIGAFVLLAIVVFLDILKGLFINERYWEAEAIVPIILLANLFLGIYHNLSIWYKLTDKTRFGMYFSIIGAVITILINIIFLEKIGYMAAAWATLIAYGVMTVISYFVGKKHYTVPYDVKTILFYIVLSVGLSYLAFIHFRNNLLVSLSILLIFGLIIYFKERKTLLKLLKNDH
jgi:O-antigen/teichoic acid export membrane protein